MTRPLTPLALLAVLFTLLLALPTAAQIELSGPLSGVLGGEDYLVVDNISVIENTNLIIEPGATFTVTGPYSFLVEGTLHANGDAGQPIVFSSDSTGWQGITIAGSFNVLTSLTYVEIRNVVSTNAGITVVQAAPVIGFCTIEGNDGPGIELGSSAMLQLMNTTISGNQNRGLIVPGGCQAIIQGGEISDNVGVFGGGIAVLGGVLNMTGTVVDNNLASGFDQPGGGGIYASSATVQLTDCIISDNSSFDDDDGGNGGGIHVSGGSLIMQNCVVNSNEMEAWDINSGGGGLYASNAAVQIADCVFEDNGTIGYQLGGAGAGLLLELCIEAEITSTLVHSNDAIGEFGFGGGIALIDCVNPTLQRVIVSENTSDVMGAGLFLDQTTGAMIDRATVYANLNILAEGDGIYARSSHVDIRNSLIAFQNGDGLFFGPNVDADVAFNDFHGPDQDHLAGDVPGLLGLINQQNYNGDPSDAFFNIFLNPLLADPENLDFAITDGSPCIDAGDPDSDYDPDGTVADIGAISYDGGAVILMMTPVLDVVPPSGGDVVYNVSLASEIAQPVPGVSWWTKVTLPNGQTLTQNIEFLTFTLPPFADIFVTGRTLSVPGFAPAGQYTYTGRVGFYPNGPLRMDSIFFTKTGGMAEDGDAGTRNALRAVDFRAGGGVRSAPEPSAQTMSN